MIELVKVPDVVPLVVFVVSVISGFVLAPQTKPLVVMVAPPVLLIVPPPIADVVVKLMNIEDSNYDPDLAEIIKERKISTATKIIDKLSTNNDEENLNSAQVLCKLL